MFVQEGVTFHAVRVAVQRQQRLQQVGHELEAEEHGYQMRFGIMPGGAERGGTEQQAQRFEIRLRLVALLDEVVHQLRVALYLYEHKPRHILVLPQHIVIHFHHSIHFCGSIALEGGDVLVLNAETVAIGLSQRTTAAAIERFAENMLNKSTFKRVLVFNIPKCRAFMHLDTVFTMVDYDKFTIHPEIEGPLQLFEITLGKDGKANFTSVTDDLTNILKKVLGLPAVELIRCGGNDPMAAQREQWNDGSNTLCIAPGTVVTYERNYVTNDLLDKKGINVLTIPSAELSRGRGGPRCMSCPVNRDDL